MHCRILEITIYQLQKLITKFKENGYEFDKLIFFKCINYLS